MGGAGGGSTAICTYSYLRVKKGVFWKNQRVRLVNPEGSHPQSEMTCCWTLYLSQGRSQPWRRVWWSQFSKCKGESKPHTETCLKKTVLCFCLVPPYQLLAVCVPSIQLLALLGQFPPLHGLQPLKPFPYFHLVFCWSLPFSLPFFFFFFSPLPWMTNNNSLLQQTKLAQVSVWLPS